MEPDAQLVPSQRQPAKPLRRLRIGTACLKTPDHPLKTQLQRRLRVILAEPAEAFLDLPEQSQSLADDTRRRFHGEIFTAHRQQHPAVELSAPSRTCGIDAAAAAVQGGAGLWQARFAAGGFQRKAKRFEPRRIVGWLEFDIAEQPAIAAEAALEAERLQAGAGRSHGEAAGA